MTWFTHINRNLLHGTEPPVRFQDGKYGAPTYCFEVELPARSGWSSLPTNRCSRAAPGS